MNVVNWFEIPVQDLPRAKAFYTQLLERPLEDMSSPIPGMAMAAFPWEMGAANAAGSLVKVEGLAPRADGTTVYFQCEDIGAALARAEAAGGKVVTPKVPIGQHGFIAHLFDSEGNRIGLHARQ